MIALAIIRVEVISVTDILIRDVPPDVLAAIDAKAEQQGLSRSEYLRRQIALDAGRPTQRVTVEDLRRTAEVFRDLDDPEVMGAAWDGHP